MSYKLPEMEVIEVHYWALLIHDEFHLDGEEYHKRYATKEEADKKLQRFIDVGLTLPKVSKGQ